jgi:hypothetical protein
MLIVLSADVLLDRLGRLTRIRGTVKLNGVLFVGYSIKYRLTIKTIVLK